jgi:hypothetical protein
MWLKLYNKTEVRYFEGSYINIHDLWPDFWVSDQSQTQSSFPEERLYSY